MGAKRLSIFSWSRLAKLAGIEYRHFTEKKLTHEEKERLIPIIEEGTNKLLEGTYKLFKADSDSSTHNTDKK